MRKIKNRSFPSTQTVCSILICLIVATLVGYGASVIRWSTLSNLIIGISILAIIPASIQAVISFRKLIKK